MTLTDPRETIRKYLNRGKGGAVNDDNLTDRNGELVGYQAHYAFSDEDLKRLMMEGPKVGIIFVIHHLGLSTVNSPSGPIGYRHRIGVQPVIIDRWSRDGTLSVYASEMLYKATSEVHRVIRERMSGSLRMTDRESAGTVERVGSTILYGVMVEVEYIQYTSNY